MERNASGPWRRLLPIPAIPRVAPVGPPVVGWGLGPRTASASPWLGGRAAAWASMTGEENAVPSRLEPGASSPPVVGEPFVALFEAHRDDLRKLCRRLLDDPAAVEDALADVFLRAHRAFPRYDARQPFKPWIRTLATNHCIDLLRRRRTERRLFADDDAALEWTGDADAPGALQQITQREDQRAVLAALDGLPARYRVPLVLRFYRDCDYDTIAETLGVSRNQVGTLLFRGKALLRKALVERRTGQGVGQQAGAAGAGARDRSEAEDDA